MDADALVVPDSERVNLRTRAGAAHERVVFRDRSVGVDTQHLAHAKIQLLRLRTVQRVDADACRNRRGDERRSFQISQKQRKLVLQGYTRRARTSAGMVDLSGGHASRTRAMSARSFWRLLPRLSASCTAQSFPCRMSSIAATGSGSPRTVRTAARS